VLDIEELTGESISAADVGIITPEVIAATFEEIVHKKVTWAQLYRVNRDILNKPGKEVIFPSANAAGGFTIETTAGAIEGKDVTSLKATVGLTAYTGTTIGVYKVAGWLKITREAIKFAMRDVIKDNIYEVGLQYKEQIDDAAYYQLIYASNKQAAETVTGFATGSSVYPMTAPVWTVNSVKTSMAGTIKGIDYAAGSIYLYSTLAAVNTIHYQVPGRNLLAITGAQPGSQETGINAWGILKGKAKLISHGRDPNVVVMSWNDMPSLLYDDKVNFLDASAYGGREPLMNAEIGKVWGLKVITESRRLPEGCAIVVDTSRLGYDVHKEELRSYRDDVYEKDMVAYYFYAERGFGITDTLAACLVMSGKNTFPSTLPVS